MLVEVICPSPDCGHRGWVSSEILPGGNVPMLGAG